MKLYKYGFKLIVFCVVFIGFLFFLFQFNFLQDNKNNSKQLTQEIAAQENLNKKEVNIYFFYGQGCPHCAKEKAYLEQIQDQYLDQLHIYEFEIYYHQENVELFQKVAYRLDVNASGVPFLIIGEDYIIGYGGDDSTGKEISKKIDYCLENNCIDPFYKILVNSQNDTNKINDLDDRQDIGNEKEKNLSEEKKSGEILSENGSSENENIDEQNSDNLNINIPIIGQIDLKKISLPLATVIIALMDGFNPCAMWILIFLITMLINLKSRKRLYGLGALFIVVSAFVYFLFMVAWLKFFQFVSYIRWIKLIVGIIAVISGIKHLQHAFFSKGECKSVNKKKQKSIMEKIKKIVKEKSFFLAVIGIIALAFSVNLIELVCSAGLPAIYTNLLASLNLSNFSYYSYLLLYIFIFMLDDLIIFFVAVRTFEVTGITNKYSKWSSIIGGIVILILGLLLIFAPQVLMFG